MLAASLREISAASRLVCLEPEKMTMMKIAIIAGATLAFVTAATAADLPHPQPVYQAAHIGKMPIGKSPVGKSPIGKTPIAARY
jgi:hypothetical protein